MRRLSFVTVLVSLFGCAVAFAQPAAPASAPASAPGAAVDDEAVVTVFNRPVAVFRVPFFGITAADRARGAPNACSPSWSIGAGPAG